MKKSEPIPRPPLIVHTICFSHESKPELEEATEIGRHLYDLLTRPLDNPFAWGAGVLVRVATRHDEVDFEEADTIFVAPILGAMSFSLEDRREQIIKLMNEWSSMGPRVYVVPVVIADSWRAEEERFPTTGLLTELYGTRENTIDRIIRAIGRSLAGERRELLKLFISHAKADLSHAPAAQEISNYVRNNTDTLSFFDEVSLIPGEERLENQLDESTQRFAFVGVRGDAYSSRAWCQLEILNAKKAQVPAVVVDVVQQGEARSYPYLGNTPTIRWPAPIGGPNPSPEERRQFEEIVHRAAGDVVRRATVECVRTVLFQREAKRLKARDELPAGLVVQMSRAPELLDLPALSEGKVRGADESGTWDPRRPATILHPDPELSVHERNVLRQMMPRLRLLTPTTSWRGSLGAASDSPLSQSVVALSLSDTPQHPGSGLEREHMVDATVYLARALISLGATIAYGGDFRKAKTTGGHGYSNLLISLITAYNDTASVKAEHLRSYRPATADIEPANRAFSLRHMGLKPYDAQVSALPKPTTPSSSALKALHTSDMRRLMNGELSGRIMIGGVTTPCPSDEGNAPGFRGFIPGTVEEAWWTTQRGPTEGRVPLYACGGFGGGARVVADLLVKGHKLASMPTTEGSTDPVEALIPQEMQRSHWLEGEGATSLSPAGVERLKTIFTAYDEHKAAIGLPEDIDGFARDLIALGREVLASDKASFRWNGLSVRQNLQLFTSRDPSTLAWLVLQGLLNCRPELPDGKVAIDIVRGDIVSARNVEMIIVPAFENSIITGAGARLNEWVEGAVDEARALGEPIMLGSPRIDADYLYVANLGRLEDATGDLDATVERVAADVARMVERYGVDRVGMVTIGGNVTSNYGETIDRMVAGLSQAGNKAPYIQWFENDEERFETLKAKLDDHPKVALSEKNIPAEDVVIGPRAQETLRLSLYEKDTDVEAVLLMPRNRGVVPRYRTSIAPEAREGLGPGNFVAPSMSTLASYGEVLANNLFQGAADLIVDAHKNARLVIQHGPEFGDLQFEAMQLRKDNAEPWTPAVGGGLVRLLETSGSTPSFRRAPHRDKLRILLVVANPKGDLDAAEKEGAKIKADLEQDRIAGRVEIVPLEGPNATTDKLRYALNNESFDLLHYAGHAFYKGPGEHESGLKLVDRHFTPADLKTVQRWPRLAFVNGCQSGRLRDEPPPEPINTAGFAELFIRRGVEAYVGTFWRVFDDTAGVFAGQLYLSLLNGHTVTRGVTDARRLLHAKKRGDWANYVLYGEADIQLIRR